MGREGVVFEVTHESNVPNAVKILFAHSGKSAGKRLRHFELLASRLEQRRSAATTAWPRVFGSGLVEIEGIGPVPYQRIEKIDGLPLGRSGSLGDLTSRLRRLDEFIRQLETLGSVELHFVHLDPENVIVDSNGRLIIIDFDGFKIGPLDDRDWYRMSRRLARTILAAIGNFTPEPVIRDRAFRGFLRRLRILRASTKRRRAPEAIQFRSLSEFRVEISRALEKLGELKGGAAVN